MRLFVRVAKPGRGVGRDWSTVASWGLQCKVWGMRMDAGDCRKSRLTQIGIKFDLKDKCGANGGRQESNDKLITPYKLALLPNYAITYP